MILPIYIFYLRIPLCREPFLAKGVYIGPHDGPLYRYYETIDAVCQPGYKLVGQISRTCIRDGQWSGIAPTCLKGIEYH